MALLIAAGIASAAAIAALSGVAINQDTDRRKTKDITLADGTSYNAASGNQWFSRGKQRTLSNGMIAPRETLSSLKKSEIDDVLNHTAMYGPMSKAEFLERVGGSAGAEDKWQWYKAALDINYAYGTIEYNSSVYKDSQDGSPNMAKMKEWESSDEGQLLVQQRAQSLEMQGKGTDQQPSYDPEANYYDLMIDTQNKQAAQYRSDMYSSIDRQQAEIDQSLAAYEIDAYKMIGQQQMQLENQIAAARQQALRSGTTSAQLAAQQLQNMFAAQSGAAQVAQGVMGQRMDNAQQFAQQRGSVEPSLYDIANQNRGLLTQAGSQNYAAYMGYASYAPHLQAQGLANLKPYVRSYYDEIRKNP